MRKCLRCESQMVEDMAVMVTNKPIGIEVREPGMFKMPLEKNQMCGMSSVWICGNLCGGFPLHQKTC